MTELVTLRAVLQLIACADVIADSQQWPKEGRTISLPEDLRRIVIAELDREAKVKMRDGVAIFDYSRNDMLDSLVISGWTIESPSVLVESIEPFSIRFRVPRPAPPTPLVSYLHPPARPFHGES